MTSLELMDWLKYLGWIICTANFLLFITKEENDS